MINKTVCENLIRAALFEAQCVSLKNNLDDMYMRYMTIRRYLNATNDATTLSQFQRVIAELNVLIEQFSRFEEYKEEGLFYDIGNKPWLKGDRTE